MGLRFRKSVKLAPGVKLNFNKKSTGITFGGKGVHYTINSKGRKTASVGVPGTGLYYTTSSTKSKKAKKTAVNNDENRNEVIENDFIKKEKDIMTGKRWYQKTWGIILCLILFFPVGLYLMCKYAEWNKGVKIAILVFFLALVLFSYMGNENTSPTDENRGAAAVVVSTEASTESTTKETTTESTTKETTTKKPTTTQPTTTEATTEATTTETTEEETTEEATEAETEYGADYTVGNNTYNDEEAHLEEDSNNEESEMVWIPNSGKKYHSNEYCSNMKNPSHVTLEEAEDLGFTACSRCW